MSYKSEQINELAAALAKAQAEYSVAGLNKANPFFKSKYADFQSVVAAARPALTKNGLAVVQSLLANDEGAHILKTVLVHSSGQYIESSMRINPVKPDIQSISSYMTYAKRMSYASLVGVVTGEEDDDGEAAVAHERKVAYQQANASRPTITEEQYDQLEFELDGFPQIAQMVLDGLKIKSLDQMPRDIFIKNIARIRELVTEERNKLK
jgi:hypothetical protein